MMEESRENSPEIEENICERARIDDNRTPRRVQVEQPTPTHRREEWSPIRRDYKQEANRRIQQSIIPTTPRIPRHQNRFSPLRYKSGYTPYREPQYRRDFFARDFRGRPPGRRGEYSPNRQGGWKPFSYPTRNQYQGHPRHQGGQQGWNPRVTNNMGSRMNDWEPEAYNQEERRDQTYRPQRWARGNELEANEGGSRKRRREY